MTLCGTVDLVQVLWVWKLSGVWREAISSQWKHPLLEGGKRRQSRNLAGFEKLGKLQDTGDLLQGYVSSNSSWGEKALRKLPGVEALNSHSPSRGGLFLNAVAFELPVFLQGTPLNSVHQATLGWNRFFGL